MTRKLRRMKMTGVPEPRDRLLLRHLSGPVRHDKGRDDKSRDEQQPEDSAEALRGFVEVRVQTRGILTVCDSKINRNSSFYN